MKRMKKIIVLLVALAIHNTSSYSFQVALQQRTRGVSRIQHGKKMELMDKLRDDDINSFLPTEFGFNFDENTMAIAAAPLFLSLLFYSDPANANQYGILAGKTASMIHPLTNFAFFATSVYSAFLGLQWRRLREIGEEIKALNGQLPKLSSGSAKLPFNDAIQSINQEIQQLSATENVDTNRISTLRSDIAKMEASRDIEAKIAEIVATRKNLVSQNLRDKHYLTGSILLGGGTSVSILGAFNTYMRAGKLFPGPHLFAGMAITILWAGKIYVASFLLYHIDL
jgi:hypothetical protein